MFKSGKQRAAFFAALQKKKAGMDDPKADLTLKKQPTIDLEAIKTEPTVKSPALPKIDKFGKLKKLMKVK
jgi:hypothetical protein